MKILIGLVVGTGLLVSLVLSSAVLARIEFEKESTKLNYEVGANDTISLIDPHSGNRAQLVVITQLPSDCWNQSSWKKGDWGRIALLRGKCRVDQRASWYPKDMPGRKR